MEYEGQSCPKYQMHLELGLYGLEIQASVEIIQTFTKPKIYICYVKDIEKVAGDMRRLAVIKLSVLTIILNVQMHILLLLIISNCFTVSTVLVRPGIELLINMSIHKCFNLLGLFQ